MTQANILAASGTQGVAQGFKNRIINGAMVIDQRNAGASVTPASSDYLVDRFFYTGTQASKFTAQQNAGSVTPPVGFINYLGMTVASAVSVAAGDTFLIGQNIEGFNTADLQWGTANAKTVTLSFQVYSSLTGTFGGALTNSAASRSYPFNYSVPTANTWTSVSITIAGDTSGTWVGATNGKGIVVRFGLGSGATYSGTAGAWSAGNLVQPTGSVSIVGTSGATFYITGVQLEVGSSATGYEYRQYGTELALCQRYYEIIGTVALTAVVANYQPVYWAVQKRAAPTVTTSAATGSFAVFSATTLASYTGAFQSAPNSSDLNVTVTGSAEL